MVRAIDELIGDLPSNKHSPWPSFECDAEESRGNVRVSSPPVDSWQSNMSVRPPTHMPPPPVSPWSASSPSSSSAVKIDVGKMVTVQELEASLHNRHQNTSTLTPSVLSRAPGGPLGNAKGHERSLESSRSLERLPTEAEDLQGKGLGTGIPPPPGFTGINRLVDPLSRLDLSETAPGYRTPSLPLYLRRGSRETSNRSLPSGGEVQDCSMWSLRGDSLRMSTTTHGELGLKNMAQSIDSFGFTSSVDMDRRDSKTYAGVLRSSLQPPAAGSETNKGEEAVFSQNELGGKNLSGTSPFYQYFP